MVMHATLMATGFYIAGTLNILYLVIDARLAWRKAECVHGEDGESYSSSIDGARYRSANLGISTEPSLFYDHRGLSFARGICYVRKDSPEYFRLKNDFSSRGDILFVLARVTSANQRSE